MTLANNRGGLGAWIVDSQRIKPGKKMPPNELSGEELNALLSYLENMIRWVQNPQAVDQKTAMPNMGVTDADARDIAAYLYTLR